MLRDNSERLIKVWGLANKLEQFWFDHKLKSEKQPRTTTGTIIYDNNC